MVHRHEKLGFELQAPDGWSLLEESDRGLVLEADSEASGFGARAAVSIDPVEPGADLPALTSRALASEARATGSMRLIDRLPDRIGSLAADRVLLHRELADRTMTVEAWRLLAGGLMVTISAACATGAYDRHAEAFAQLARSFRLGDSPLPRERLGPMFEPAAGLLVVTDAGFDALRAVAQGHEPESSASGELEALRTAGAIIDGQPHPTLAQALAPVTSPVLEISLARTSTTMRGWADQAGATLLVPVGAEDWRRLLHVRADLLPATLADLVDLRPTGAPRDAETIALPGAALARIVAAERGQELTAQRLAEIPAGALTALTGLRDHWRIEATRTGSEAVEMLEVLRTDSTLWLAVGQGTSVELRPTDASTVWRHLTQFSPTPA